MTFLTNMMDFLSNIEWFRGQSPPPTGPFIPGYDDIRRVRALLRTMNLPTELVLDILDRADYWPIYEFQPDINPYGNGNARFTASARNGRPAAATLCLDAPIFNNPIANPIRAGGDRIKIVALEFDMASRDQGWTSEETSNTFHTSSWLEVSILRGETNNNASRLVNKWLSSPADYHNNIADRGWCLAKRPEHVLQGPQHDEGDFAWYLQGNRVAAKHGNYRVVWAQDKFEYMREGNQGSGKGQGFFQELKDGDRVIVWARAKWPGWECIVESLKVSVHYRF